MDHQRGCLRARPAADREESVRKARDGARPGRDTHRDHRAAGLLTVAVSTRYGVLSGVRYWIVHGGEGWPTPRGLLPGVPLTAAPRSHALALAAFALEPAEEDRKLQAVRAYDT